MSQLLSPSLPAMPDIHAAVAAFVNALGLPALPASSVFQGWGNRMALPAGSDEYAVISLLSQRRRGTNVSAFSAPDPEANGIRSQRELVEALVQVDCCSRTDAARMRAQALETAARSEFGPEFFARHGMGCLYADDARDISFVGDAKQFVRRWMTVLHLTYVAGLDCETQWFARAELSRLENVDVHHPPTTT